MSIVIALLLCLQEAKSDVNIIIDEHFDEPRADGVTRAGDRRPVTAEHAGGRFTLQTFCHWRRQERPLRVPPQDDDEEETPRVEPVASSVPIRGAGVGAKYQLGTHVDIPSVGGAFADGTPVEFGDVDSDPMPGAYLGLNVGVDDFDAIVFVDWLSGPVEADDATTRQGFIPPNRPFLITDSFELTGDLWLLEVGFAPVLKRFETGALRVDLGVAAGAYFGKLSNLEIARRTFDESTGLTTNEKLSPSDESLFGGFAGPTVHASLALGSGWRVGALVESYRLFGDVSGWSHVAGIEFGRDF